MKRLISLFTLLLAHGVFAADNTTLNKLEQLQWQNRVILVFSDRVDHYQQVFDDAESQVKDRDIVWFIIDGKQVITNYSGKLSDRFGPLLHQQFKTASQEVILIGKDSGVKLQGQAYPIKSLFDEIDTMPMRIREMQENTD